MFSRTHVQYCTDLLQPTHCRQQLCLAVQKAQDVVEVTVVVRISSVSILAVYKLCTIATLITNNLQMPVF